VPAIPDGERGRRGAAAAAPRTPSPEGAAAVRRRRLITAAGVGVLILVGVLIWPGQVLTGGGDDDDEPSQASTGSQQQGGGDGSPIPTEMEGQAILARQQGQNQLLVTATGLEPSTQNTAYQVYLSNGERDRRSLGAAVTDGQGNLQGGGPLPRNFRDYEFIDLTSVTVTGQGRNQRFEDGPVVLRGLLEVRDNPITRQGITLLGEVRMRPLPE
jgi:hypothetical protein